MKKPVMKLIFGGLLPVLLMTMGCATTQTKSSWQPEGEQYQPKRLLVAVVSKSSTIRRSAEDEIVKILSGKGIEARQSYLLWPDVTTPTKEEVLEKLNEFSFDAAMVTKLVDRKQEESYVNVPMHRRPYYTADFATYYMDSFDYLYSPGYKVTNDVVLTQTNVYRIENEELIWTTLSESILADGVSEADIKGFAKSVANGFLNRK